MIFKKRFWQTNVEALWAIFSLMLQVLPEIYNTILLANYDDANIVAGAGLGVMLINMFVYGVFEGLNGAVDTYVSQYYGSGDNYNCNLVYNRARMINSVLFIPVAILLSYSEAILLMLDQPREVAEVSRIYLIYQLPGLFFVVHFDTLRRYLQSQGIFDISTKCLIFTTIFHVIFLTGLISIVDTSPVILVSSATNVTMILDFVLWRYWARDQLKNTNYLPITQGAFSEWKDYLVLALPSAFIICAEWWMFEVLAIFAGLLGVVYLATLIIIFNTHNLAYDISYGLSQAASSQIGRTLAELGESAAKKLLKLIVTMQIMICIVITMIFYFYADAII